MINYHLNSSEALEAALYFGKVKSRSMPDKCYITNYPYDGQYYTNFDLNTYVIHKIPIKIRFNDLLRFINKFSNNERWGVVEPSPYLEQSSPPVSPSPPRLSMMKRNNSM